MYSLASFRCKSDRCNALSRAGGTSRGAGMGESRVEAKPTDAAGPPQARSSNVDVMKQGGS
jgi:hypothetical protein